MIWLVSAALLVASTWFVLELPSERFLHYPFAFVGFGTFLVVGPEAAALVLGAAVIGAVARRWTASTSAGRQPRAVLTAGLAIAAGIGAGHGAHYALGASYPVALAGAFAMPELLAILGTAFVVLGAVKELVTRVFARRRDGATVDVSGGLQVFAAGIVLGAPIQLAAHAIYVPSTLVPWSCAMGWSFLVNVVIGFQVARMRRNIELVDRLATQEQLAAIGEVTARIVHQTRHQLGLIGMIAHQIERQIRTLPHDDARAIREQLARLEAVHEDLGRMLSFDSNHDHLVARDDTYESVVQRQCVRLEPLATSRGVRLVVSVAPSTDRPADPDKLGQAVFNVIENAIAAARAEVRVELRAREPGVIIDVSDDGDGMSADMLARATKPFVTTKPDGSGMGLAIANAVAQEEDGELVIENREQGGLLVRFAIPRAPVTG